MLCAAGAAYEPSFAKWDWEAMPMGSAFAESGAMLRELCLPPPPPNAPVPLLGLRYGLASPTFVAKAGAFVHVPKGTPHTITRVEQKPVKFLVVYSPAGFEKFFDEAVDLDVTDTETYVAKAEALAKKYNIKFVGPPLEGLAAFRHSTTSQIWSPSW